MNFRIKTLYAFVAVGENGDEGVMAERVGQHWVPFVAADATRLGQLRDRVRQIAPPYAVKLIKFEPRTELETVHPGLT